MFNLAYMCILKHAFCTTESSFSISWCRTTDEWSTVWHSFNFSISCFVLAAQRSHFLDKLLNKKQTCLEVLILFNFFVRTQINKVAHRCFHCWTAGEQSHSPVQSCVARKLPARASMVHTQLPWIDLIVQEREGCVSLLSLAGTVTEEQKAYWQRRWMCCCCLVWERSKEQHGERREEHRWMQSCRGSMVEKLVPCCCGISCMIVHSPQMLD